MATIDDKVVAMSFESSKFESGVNKTLSALDKLKQSLKFPGAGKGLDEIHAAGKRVDFSHIGTALDDIKNRLGVFRLAAIGALSQIATSAIRAGTNFAKAFTLDPIKAGFSEYTTNLNAVQTILANTQASGAKLKDVNAALLELNRYSDKTIYNFAQMARNIGTFTAAGVDLTTATGAIKGIANLAALSGSSADQASTAMYQLSQAISAGRVSLQDWNSVVNAGMGGTVFQRALAQTAVAMGKLKEGSLKLVGPMKNVSINGESFRQSMMTAPGKTSWLTSDVLTNTLKQFTSDMSVAELKAQGFNDAQIKAIQATAKTAMEAATKVKTLSQVLEVAKETAQSGWAQTWQIVFGNFGEARTLFTGVSNAVNGFVNTSANARNKVLGDWKELGGRTVLIEAIKTTFQALGAILKPIKEAFRDIFPAKTGKDLYDLTLRFKEFAETLKPSPETVKNLHRTFEGLFALLDIGKQVISGVFTIFSKLFHTAGAGEGGFLSFTATIGDFLVNLDKVLKKGKVLNTFFEGVGSVLSVPIELLRRLAQAIANLFSGFSPGEFSAEMDSITKVTQPFKRAIEAIAKALTELGSAIGNALGQINWETVLSVVRTGLLVGLVLMLKKFIGGTTLPQLFGVFGKSVGKSFGKGILGNIGKSFGSLTGTLKSMQQELKAKTLLEIAGAIALLAAAVLALSLVDPDKLSGALGAMTVMMGELLGALVILDKITGAKSFIKLPVIAASLIMLAGAIDLLVIAVIAMSRLSWEELAKGLGAVGALLGSLAVVSGPLSRNASGMIRAGIGITAIAVALKILASAMADFGGMSWTELGKGMAGIGIGLGLIAAGARAMPKNMAIQGAGLAITAVGLKLLADAVSKFGGMNWVTIGKGLAGIGGALVVIAGAMHIMPKTTPIMAAGLLLVAASLGKIAQAVQNLGGMSIEALAKGLISLGVALGILAVALHGMAGTVTGAIALGIAATGLSLLANSLVKIGGLSWGSLLKGLIGLGAAIGIIVGASLLLSSSIPALLGFGAALVAIGAGIALAGAGIALIGVGLSAIAASGSVAISILIKAMTDFVAAIVKIAKNIVQGLLEIVQGISETAPQFTKALIVILENLLNVVIQSAPKIAQAFEALLLAALDVLTKNADKLVQAGFDLLMALLRGVSNNIGQIVTTVADIIVKFLSSLGSNIGRIITAGADLLVKFLSGIANNLGLITTAVFNIITTFLTSIASNLSRVVTAGLSILTKLLTTIASNLGQVITAGTDVIVSFVTGMGRAGERIVTAGTNAMIKFITALSKKSVDLVDAAFEAILNFLRGLRQAIDKYEPQIIAEGGHIGWAIVTGIIKGLVAWAPSVYDKAKEIGGKVIDTLGKAVHWLTGPSAAAMDIGGKVVQGFAIGLSRAQPALDAAITMSKGVIQAVNNTFQTGSPSKVMEEIGKFVGQGFAKGLRGSTEDIKSAFTELNNQLLAGIKEAKDTQNKSLEESLTTAHTTFVTSLKDEREELIKLSLQYTNVGNKLQAAQNVLINAIQTRNDAIKNFTQQYSALPSIVTTDAEGNAVDQLAMYLGALQHQADAITAYQSTLAQLRKLGLDDATYQKLVSEGPVDQQFASQLLAGGKNAVQSLNTLDANLMKVSKTLAVNAANNLYQAGVDAAEGLVKGLEKKRSAIHKLMEDIAEEMLAAIKKKLRIKSPSEAFAEIGGYLIDGMAEGIRDSGAMTDALNQAAVNALEEMRKSMRNTSGLITDELSLNPIVTPILDLTQVKSQAERINALLAAGMSAESAWAISAQQNVVQTEETSAIPAAASVVTFNQNNYSPEALSDVEIYRQTKNQISQLKSLLAV